MRASSSNIPLEADHLDERMHNLNVNDALYEAILHRIRTAREYLAKARDTSEASTQAGKQLEALSVRLRAAKGRMETYLEADQYDSAKAKAIKDLTLELADSAENLVRRLETIASHPEMAVDLGEQLAEITRISEEVHRLIP